MERTGTRPAGGPELRDSFVGRQIDRYRIIEKIAEGGMGSIYAVEHVALRKRMAMKILRPDLLANQELATRFHNEAIAASRIGHPNIVDVTDFGWTDDGLAFLVMEELRGRSLAQLLADEPGFSCARALRIATQVGRALEAAHVAGIVHRDIKPDNVVVVPRDGAEWVKVLDFGISKIAVGDQHLTRVGTILGTPEYMSPEQAAGQPVDRRADIYAFGVLLFEMLAGRPPFTDPNPVQVLLLHRSAPVPSLHGFRPGLRVPAELLALIRTALAKDPAHRPQRMADCLAVLRQAAAQLATLPPSPPPARRTPRPAATKPSAHLAPTLVSPPPRANDPRSLECETRPLRLVVRELTPLPLTPQEAFVASRLSGCDMTAAQVIQASGLPKPRTLEILHGLLAKQVIALQTRTAGPALDWGAS